MNPPKISPTNPLFGLRMLASDMRINRSSNMIFISPGKPDPKVRSLRINISMAYDMNLKVMPKNIRKFTKTTVIIMNTEIEMKIIKIKIHIKNGRLKGNRDFRKPGMVKKGNVSRIHRLHPQTMSDFLATLQSPL